MNHTGASPIIIFISLILLNSALTLVNPQQARAKSPSRRSNESETAESQIAAGDRARLAGNYPQAQQLIMLGIEKIEKSKNPEPQRLAAAYNYLALLNNNMGKYADSENNARKALVFSRKAGLGENIISRHKVVLANALRQQGKYPEALKNLEQATVELKNSNTDKQLFATATNNLGALYFWMGNLPKAKLLLEQGLSLRLALNEDKKQNLDIANSYLDLGCCEFKLGQTGKAKEHLLLALKLRKNELGDEHPETLNAKANLAALLDASENSADREQALKLLQEVVTSGSRKLDAKHPELIRYQHEYAEALTNSGNLLSNKGQQEAALKAFKDAIQIEDGISKIRGYKDITYAVTLANAAAVLTRLNRPAESQAMLKKAIAIIDALPLSERNSPDAKAIRRSSKLSKSIRKHH